MEYGSEELREFLQRNQIKWEEREEAVNTVIDAIAVGVFDIRLSDGDRIILGDTLRELYDVAYERGKTALD